MLESVTVKDYVAKSSLHLTTDMQVMHAIQKLVENRVSGAPVLDLHGNLVGMLSQKDCLKVALSSSYHDEVAGSVAEHMSRQVTSLNTDNSILEAIELFVKFGYQRIPVMEENRMVGVISQHDALRALKTLRG